MSNFTMGAQRVPGESDEPQLCRGRAQRALSLCRASCFLHVLQGLRLRHAVLAGSTPSRQHSQTMIMSSHVDHATMWC